MQVNINNKRLIHRLTNVHEAAVVLDALVGAADGVGLLLGLGNLGGLTTHLTGTGEGTVNLTWSEEKGGGEDRRICLRAFHWGSKGRCGY